MKIQLFLFYIIFLYFFSLAKSSGLKSKGNTFREIQNQFKPYFKQMKQLVDTTKSVAVSEKNEVDANSISSLEILKLKFRLAFKRQVNICYERFQRCSEQLSAAFCASSTKNITFYLWARNVAEEIMNGHSDDEKYPTVKCSPELLRNFLLSKI